MPHYRKTGTDVCGGLGDCTQGVGRDLEVGGGGGVKHVYRVSLQREYIYVHILKD